jgi:hypothetical protein
VKNVSEWAAFALGIGIWPSPRVIPETLALPGRGPLRTTGRPVLPRGRTGKQRVPRLSPTGRRQRINHRRLDTRSAQATAEERETSVFLWLANGGLVLG